MASAFSIGAVFLEFYVKSGQRIMWFWGKALNVSKLSARFAIHTEGTLPGNCRRSLRHEQRRICCRSQSAAAPRGDYGGNQPVHRSGTIVS